MQGPKLKTLCMCYRPALGDYPIHSEEPLRLLSSPEHFQATCHHRTISLSRTKEQHTLFLGHEDLA